VALDEGDGPAQEIGVRLDELLADRGLTLVELSHRVEVTVVNLSILKNGRAKAIRFSTLAKLCRALDCQPGDLLAHIPAGAGARGPADADRAPPAPSTS
jgi:putative transcriptional regulator